MPRILRSSKVYVIYVYQLHSRQFLHHILINLSSASGRVSWINCEQTNVSRTIRENFSDDEDADSAQNNYTLNFYILKVTTRFTFL